MKQKVAKETHDCKITSRTVSDSELERLSMEKHKLRMDIGSQRNPDTANELNMELREVKKASKKRRREIEVQQINDRIANIEAMRDDSTRYFAVLKEINSKRKREGISVRDKEGRTASTEETQVKIVTDYFKEVLAPEDKSDEILEFQPHEMKIPS